MLQENIRAASRCRCLWLKGQWVKFHNYHIPRFELRNGLRGFVKVLICAHYLGNNGQIVNLTFPYSSLIIVNTWERLQSIYYRKFKSGGKCWAHREEEQLSRTEISINHAEKQSLSRTEKSICHTQGKSHSVVRRVLVTRRDTVTR